MSSFYVWTTNPSINKQKRGNFTQVQNGESLSVDLLCGNICFWHLFSELTVREYVSLRQGGLNLIFLKIFGSDQWELAPVQRAANSLGSKIYKNTNPIQRRRGPFKNDDIALVSISNIISMAHNMHNSPANRKQGPIPEEMSRILPTNEKQGETWTR
jgi:hypothetical protein